MFDKLEEQLEQVKADLAEPIPEPGASQDSPVPKKRGAKKVAKKAAKKVVKKVAKKTEKKSESKSNGDQVSLKDLAKEAEIGEQRARQKLREAEVERTGRWSWERGSRGLQAARKALGLT